MINKQNILMDYAIVQSPGNIVSDMDGEKVMLSVDNGKYYNLGELGSAIWDLMKDQILVDQLVNILISEYDVEKIECRSQVLSFLSQLYEEGLIQIKDRE